MAQSIERLTVRVVTVRQETTAIAVYELADAQGADLPSFTAGAHIDVLLPSGLVRQYSLCNDPSDGTRYFVAVQREAHGRGGSAEVHETFAAGRLVEITAPQNHFPLSPQARSHLLIAGGIGITPILAMVGVLSRGQAEWSLHYCTRSPEQTAFREFLTAPGLRERVHFHHDDGDPSKGLDTKAMLAGFRQDCHVYCCGPGGLMQAVREAGQHWPKGTLHFEHFSPDPISDRAPDSTGAFQVELASSGRVFDVPADKSILDVLRAAGLEVDYMCQEGVCGTCLTEVLEGVPDHRDLVLDEEEKAANKLIAICCSRARSPKLKLGL